MRFARTHGAVRVVFNHPETECVIAKRVLMFMEVQYALCVQLCQQYLAHSERHYFW